MLAVAGMQTTLYSLRKTNGFRLYLLLGRWEYQIGIQNGFGNTRLIPIPKPPPPQYYYVNLIGDRLFGGLTHTHTHTSSLLRDNTALARQKHQHSHGPICVIACLRTPYQSGPFDSRIVPRDVVLLSSVMDELLFSHILMPFDCLDVSLRCHVAELSLCAKGS